MSDSTPEIVIALKQVGTRFGSHVVHERLDLEVRRGEIFALIGGSGSGKSTLLREMILLRQPDEGSISVLGVELRGLGEDDALALRKRWGVMFQHGGLFGALTVAENIGLPLREHTERSNADIDAVAAAKLALAGLPPGVGAQYPAELSGGMMKRASLARALVMDPELLFLDEPTAGLDPASAGGFDELMLSLRASGGLTIVMVTHDLDLLWQVADRVAVLGLRKVLAVGTMAELSRRTEPEVRQFFDGARGRAAMAQGEPHAARETA